MPFAAVNGIDLYYEVHGQGPAVLFCHGSGGNHLSWWQQVPHFSGRYTCITFDHRAFGRSQDVPDGPGRTSFAADAVALLDHLQIERVSIVAHSMGGRTAFGLTNREPERVTAIALCGTTAGCTDDHVRALQERYRAANGHRPDIVIRGLSAQFARGNMEWTFLYRSLLRLNPRRPPDFLALRPGYRGSSAQRLAELRIPMLFIAGEDDVITPAPVIEAAARLVPHAQFVPVPNAGHSVYYEQPQTFNRLVDEFLTTNAPAT
jgi:pimeloyl-ACP methyl ester carboxylesterase